MKIFSGIGSRETPQDDLYLLRDASKYFCGKGYILRSGAAFGADKNCERGCDMVNGKKEIYLPWRGFNDSESNLFPDNLPKWLEAQTIAKQFHPAWDRLGDAARKLHSRNSMQILGKNLDNPVDFVLCYCPIVNGEHVGGTSQALRLAKHYGIPIINIFNEEHKKKLIKKIYSKG